MCRQRIKTQVLEEGRLQFVIGLLSQACIDWQQEAALQQGPVCSKPRQPVARSVLLTCHTAQHIKRRVLEEGALQPVIGLLSSSCTESQREAALLLGQFATTDPDYKAKIVQRGAVPPLIEMLSHVDLQLKEMAAFALGRLAQNPENQAGIVQVSSQPECSSYSCHYDAEGAG